MKDQFKFKEYRLYNQLLAALLVLVVLVGLSCGAPYLPKAPAATVDKVVKGLQGLMLLNALVILRLGWQLTRLVQLATHYAKAIAEGREADTSSKIFLDSELYLPLQSLAKAIWQATHFAKAVGEGRLTTEAAQLSQASGLGQSLLEMRSRLVSLSEEEKQRNWVISGQAKFGEIFSSHQNSDLQKLSAAFIEALAPYLQARQGAVYLVEEEAEKELVLAAGFACSRNHQRRIAWKEGIIGASVSGVETLYLNDVPDDYIQISSALGSNTPKNILIIPIRHNDRVYGAVELAAFCDFPSYQIQFAETVCASFAASIEAVSFNTTTQKLLLESQQIADELRLKEETLRQNAEELLATQEELNRKLHQIEQESALTSSIVQAINKTNAALELDMEGHILDVNEMYLSLMEYTRDELIGKAEKNFVSSEELNGQRYDMMWESIRTGAYNSGEFKRISKSGRELWLTGTYSPILDVEGKPYKIVQFAQFTTEQKERELELVSKIEAINQCIALAELNLEGRIATANQVFLQQFGFKRIEMRSKSFAELLQVDEAQRNEYQQFWSSIIADGVGQKVLQMHTKNGDTKYFISSFSASKNLEGVVCRILVVLQDITEQHNLREQVDRLLTEEKRKNAILEMQAEATDQFIDEISDILIRLEDRHSLFDLGPILQRKNLPIIEFSRSGHIQLVNDAASRLLGIEAVNLNHTSFFDILHFAREDELQYFKERIEQRELIQLKLQFTTIQNPSIRFNAYLAPHFTGADEDYHLVMMIMNVENVANSFTQTIE